MKIMKICTKNARVVLGALAIQTLYSSSSFLSAQVTYYVNSGDTPMARIFYSNATDHTSLIVDLVGHLVPQQ